mgnify:CR=1 FL=1
MTAQPQTVEEARAALHRALTSTEEDRYAPASVDRLRVAAEHAEQLMRRELAEAAA